MQNNPTPSPVSSNNQQASDEIDLRELFAAIGRFFKRIGLGILNLIVRLRQATRKFWILIIICVLAGAAIGYGSYVAFKPYYASQLQVSSEYYKINTLEDLIEGLDQLAAEGGYGVLAEKLNISSEQAATIRSFELTPEVNPDDLVKIESLMLQVEGAEGLTEEQLAEIRTLLTRGVDYYTITVTFYELNNLDALEQGLVGYLSNNNYIERRVKIEQANLQALREKLVADLQELQGLKKLQADALSRAIESGRTGSNNVILGNPESATDPLNVYREDISLYQRLLSINRRLELNQSLEVVSGFTPFQNPASISLSGRIILGALVGLAVAYLLILLIAMNQALNRYEAKRFA